MAHLFWEIVSCVYCTVDDFNLACTASLWVWFDALWVPGGVDLTDVMTGYGLMHYGWS